MPPNIGVSGTAGDQAPGDMMYRIEFEPANGSGSLLADRWTVLYSDGDADSSDHEVCALPRREEAVAFVAHFDAAGSPAIATAAFLDAEKGAWLMLDKLRAADEALAASEAEANKAARIARLLEVQMDIADYAAERADVLAEPGGNALAALMVEAGKAGR